MSNGAERRPETALGLRGYAINFDSASDVKMAVTRLRNAGYEVDTSGIHPFVRDPAGNGVWLHT